MFEDIFSRKKLIPAKLMQYGFQRINETYSFTTEILNGAFILTIAFDEQSKADTSLIEKDTDEEYVLYKTSAQGSFIGEIRAAITEILEDIANKCFKVSIFKQDQTLHLIDYVASMYGDELEFLWQKFPDNGVWRRKDTNKWYGAILTIGKNKLGFDSSEIVEIIDLRTPPETINDRLKQNGFYPGWHMNKKNWFTVILDGSVSTENLYQLIQESYKLAIK